MPFARPKPLGGTTAARIFEAQGNPALSPNPSISLSSKRTVNECAKPTSMVADAHTASPTASTRCAPKRSASRPMGICMTA